MGSMSRFWDQHHFLMLQFFSLPFAFLFYFLATRGYLSLTYRYLFVSAGGCVLAVVTMGVYSSLLFTSTLVFLLLLLSMEPRRLHLWLFGLQMLWQTFWHLLVQYREHYLQEPVSSRLFVAVSSLMLLTQRTTSVSMDLQEKLLTFPASCRQKVCAVLPLLSYTLSFTSLLGGPLCSYRRFVSLMSGISTDPPPPPLGVVLLKLLQVLSLEVVRYSLVYILNDPSGSTSLLRLWGLAVVLRIQYYSHWRISECLNNAAGFGFWEDSPGAPAGWSGLSDGGFCSIEGSIRVSEFARRWNGTTASWLRRLVYDRCRRFPLFLTFSFSLWWHGCHVGHCVGFLSWAAAVEADHHTHRYLRAPPSSAWRNIYTCLSWINTQMTVACVVIAVELRDTSGLRLLSSSYISLFPLFNIILLFVFMKINPVYK